MAAHRDRFGVVPICRVLQVAPCAVRSALSRPPGRRRLADEALKPRIAELHAANYSVYGARKIRAALARTHGEIVDRARVTRLMRELGLRGATRTRSTITTRSDRSSPRAPDLVQRRFRADRPNELWVSDLTYLPTWSGFAYAAFIVDVYSRRVVGWRVGATMTAEWSPRRWRWRSGTGAPSCSTA